MKNRFLIITLVLLVVPCLFAGCFGGNIVNNTTDIVAQSTTNDEGKTFYTCKKLSLITEVNGYYSVNKPFVLDENDETKRIYDDVYFYVDDFFYMDRANSWDIYCTLSDPADSEYAEVEKSEGVDIQINIKKAGIYKIIFDISTLSFDLEFKSEITTPVYEEIKNCDMYYSGAWVPMQKEGDEFYIKNFSIETSKFVSFFSHIHTSNFKTTVEQGTENPYIRKIGSKANSQVYFKNSGTYNIYINAKTYVVRVEPVE